MPTPVSIIIPVYNEKETLSDVVSSIRKALSDQYEVEIIVVDDGSTDGLGVDHIQPPVEHFVRHPRNLGYGAALKTGFRHASSEHVVIIDADATYPAEAIPSLLTALENNEMAIGARTGRIVHFSFFRQPARFLFHRLANYLAEQKIPDLNSGLRAFRRSSALQFLHLLPNRFSFTATLTLAFLCFGLPVAFIPINYYPRRGKSKIRPLPDTQNMLITIIRTILYFNPMRVCLPLSLLLFTLALVVLLISALFMQRVMDGTVTVLTLTGVQVFVIGMLADLIVRRSLK